MGASFTNYQVRTQSVAAVKAALAPLIRTRAYVSPEKNGWVTVYEESSETQDEAILKRLAGSLSKTLDTAVFGFLVHDSDIAVYWLYQGGALTDEYNSAPEYFDKDVDEATRARVRGSVDVLLPLCLPGTTREQIEAIIHPANDFPLMAEDILNELAGPLGIQDPRISLGFEYFDGEGEDILPDAHEFEPVGKKAARKKASSPQSAEQPVVPMPDMFPAAIGMLTKGWTGEFEKMSRTFAGMFPGQQSQDMVKQLHTQFDRGARDFYKSSQLPGLPAFEALKAARDQGPEALAKLLAQHTPDQFGDIAMQAIIGGMETFLAALLSCGLDPNAKDHHGHSLMVIAEKPGKNPAIYRLLQSASGKKS